MIPAQAPKKTLSRTTSSFFPEVDADGFAHDSDGGFSLFLQERCKRIFFIRHAECAMPCHTGLEPARRGSVPGRARPQAGVLCYSHT